MDVVNEVGDGAKTYRFRTFSMGFEGGMNATFRTDGGTTYIVGIHPMKSDPSVFEVDYTTSTGRYSHMTGEMDTLRVIGTVLDVAKSFLDLHEDAVKGFFVSHVNKPGSTERAGSQRSRIHKAFIRARFPKWQVRPVSKGFLVHRGV